MRLLFDTHALIWWHSEPARLPPQVLALCQDASNTLLISVASIWEMQIKVQTGKLQLKTPLPVIIESEQNTNGAELLPVMLPHVLALDTLPTPHKDPFDRLLIAQARFEDLTLISRDPMFAQYPVKVVW